MGPCGQRTTQLQWVPFTCGFYEWCPLDHTLWNHFLVPYLYWNWEYQRWTPKKNVNLVFITPSVLFLCILPCGSLQCHLNFWSIDLYVYSWAHIISLNYHGAIKYFLCSGIMDANIDYLFLHFFFSTHSKIKYLQSHLKNNNSIWNISQPLKRMQSCHLWPHGRTSRASCWVK